MKKAAFALVLVITVFTTYGTDSSSVAQESDTSQNNARVLDKMVITATRTSRRISETPASVSVISKNEIETMPARNIDDLIMGETSVNIRRVAGLGEGIPSDINMRGIPGALAASRTLILVDGIPTNASGTPFLVINEIPIEAVERIEIVRGPCSSLYGANALGGVINVITRCGDGKPSGAGFLETSYPFSMAHSYLSENRLHGRDLYSKSAEDGLWNVGGISSGGNERFNYMVSGGYRRVGDYYLSDSVLVVGMDTSYMIPDRNHDYRDFRFFGSLGVRPNNKINARFNARYFNSSLGFGQTKYIVPDSSDIDIDGEKFLAGPDVRIKINDIADLRIAGYYRRVGGEYWNEDLYTSLVDTTADASEAASYYVPSYWKSVSNDWQIESQIFLKLGKHNVVTAGMEYLRNAIDFGGRVHSLTKEPIPGSNGKSGVIGNAAAYLQDEISLFGRLNMVPGLRYDYHSDFGGAISPKFTAGYSIIEQIRARVSAGRAFRAPTHTELNMPDLPVNSDFTLKSNPNLKPEYLWALDGAVDVWPVPEASITAGVFSNFMKDLIVQGVGEIGNTFPAPVTHRNTSEAWSRGLELEGKWQALSWLSVEGNYVFQRTRDVSMSNLRREFGLADSLVSLDYMPEHSAGFELKTTKKFKKLLLSVSISEELVGKRSYLDWTHIDPSDAEQFRADYYNGAVQNIRISPKSRELSSYWRTDISFNIRMGEYFLLNLMIQNLFNATFEESGGNYAPGRFASIKLTGGQF
jgi:outer membrane receptor for ferrienterochelin and colicins